MGVLLVRRGWEPRLREASRSKILSQRSQTFETDPSTIVIHVSMSTEAGLLHPLLSFTLFSQLMPMLLFLLLERARLRVMLTVFAGRRFIKVLLTVVVVMVWKGTGGCVVIFHRVYAMGMMSSHDIVIMDWI